MIGPNLATMLALILTDANLGPDDAEAGLKDAADESFNCISVDGHTSTNDTVLLLANGAAGGPQLAGQALAKFQATLVEVCEDLAQSIPADGEGASHLITVEIHGCQTRAAMPSKSPRPLQTVPSSKRQSLGMIPIGAALSQQRATLV